MPYKVVKNGTEDTPYCVYKIGADNQPEGKTLGCHPSESKAQDQITAEKGEQSMPKSLSYLRAYPVRQDDIEDDPNAPIRFVASTEGLKADGMNLKTSDWLLGRYEKHPVVLYAHDYLGTHLPLGSGKPLIDGSRLLIDVTFDDADEFARSVRAKTKKGLMAGSVGWTAMEAGNELLEFSIVPVPLDPDALPMRQASGRRALQDWLDEVAVDSPPVNDGQEQVIEPELDNLSGGARLGAVLSARNLRDLEEAVNLVKGVIERAKKEEAPEGEPERGVDNLAILTAIQTKLKSISGA